MIHTKLRNVLERWYVSENGRNDKKAAKGIADLCAPKGNCTHIKMSTS